MPLPMLDEVACHGYTYARDPLSDYVAITGLIPNLVSEPRFTNHELLDRVERLYRLLGDGLITVHHEGDLYILLSGCRKPGWPVTVKPYVAIALPGKESRVTIATVACEHSWADIVRTELAHSLGLLAPDEEYPELHTRLLRQKLAEANSLYTSRGMPFWDE